MKKILILANNSWGLYNFRLELIQHILSIGFDVYFAVPEPEDDEKVKLLIENGFKYIQTSISRRGMNLFKELGLVKKYEDIIQEINPDLVLTYTIKPNVYGTYAANKYKKPVIMNITGIGHSLYTGVLKGVIKKLYKHACSKAKFVFFQNSSNKSFFVSNNLVTPSKTRQIPGSGVNIDKYRPVSKIHVDDIIRFMFVGRIMKEKGIDEYLQVAEIITKNYEKTEFLILGNFEEANYKKTISEISNQRINYLGGSSDVRNEIREIDCIINPSYHEGMSNVLLEGAAMGKPLIASNIPGCQEIIDEGENGYLFEVKSTKSLEDKIIRFIELSQEDREKMGQNSRRKIEKEFSRNIVINEYMKAITDIIKS